MDAVMILDTDGTSLDATPAALELLGVSLDQLRSLPPNAFSPEPRDLDADAAFRSIWQDEGSPDIGGETTIQRLDGTKVRVRFAIRALDDGRFEAVLEPVTAPVSARPTVYTAGQVLSEWRAAERQLTTLEQGSPEWQRVQRLIEAFRARYQGFFTRTTDLGGG